MADLPFTHSEPLTIGIEEELFLLDADVGGPALRADELLDGSWETIASPGGWFTAELLRSSIELSTAPSADLEQLDVDLAALRTELVERAAALGMHVAALGMQPDLIADASMISPRDAHQEIAALHQRVGTLGEQVTHGIHVHVGVPDLESAVRVMHALAAFVPLFVAVSANSPVVAAARSPWRSARADVRRRMLWAGATPRFADAADYERVHRLVQLENPGQQRFLWDVAPVLELGTVEVRAIDANADPVMALALAALIQGIAAHVLDGGTVERESAALERHNSWSAMEFGMRARFLSAAADGAIDATAVLHQAIELARPHARALGSEPYLDLLTRWAEESPADAALRAFDEHGTSGLLAHARLTPRA